ncbi:MAG: NADH-quinone oxidoreductase subunit J [Deltaproteobacteria bacterium]|nr:NADH-quinone oxidoreductase subunit J [Deltaproteobacteria bacterium]
MSVELIVFYILAAGVVVPSLLVILPPVGRNPIYGAVSLIAAFFFLAGIFVLLAAHLIAALQILVYAGAIMVLFIFVIMLLNLTKEDLSGYRITITKVLGLAAGVFILIKLAIIMNIAAGADFGVDFSGANFTDFGSVQSVGRLLFTDYLYPVELASILLLVAIIGAVVIAKKRLEQ